MHSSASGHGAIEAPGRSMALLITPFGRSLKFRPGRAPAYGSRTASSPDAVQGRPQPTNSGRPLAPSPPASSRARDWPSGLSAGAGPKSFRRARRADAEVFRRPARSTTAGRTPLTAVSTIQRVDDRQEASNDPPAPAGEALNALDPRDHRGLPVGDLHQQVQRGREPSGRDPVRAQRRHDVRGHGLGGPVEHPDRAHIRLDPLGGLPRRLFIDRPPASAGPCPAGRPDRPAPAIAPTNNHFSRSTRRSCAMVIEARKTG